LNIEVSFSQVKEEKRLKSNSVIEKAIVNKSIVYVKGFCATKNIMIQISRTLMCLRASNVGIRGAIGHMHTHTPRNPRLLCTRYDKVFAFYLQN